MCERANYMTEAIVSFLYRCSAVARPINSHLQHHRPTATHMFGHRIASEWKRSSQSVGSISFSYTCILLSWALCVHVRSPAIVPFPKTENKNITVWPKSNYTEPHTQPTLNYAQSLYYAQHRPIRCDSCRHRNYNVFPNEIRFVYEPVSDGWRLLLPFISHYSRRCYRSFGGTVFGQFMRSGGTQYARLIFPNLGQTTLEPRSSSRA